MARRASKAANRRARQRPPRRPIPPSPAPAPSTPDASASTLAPAASADESDTASVHQVSAVERAPRRVASQISPYAGSSLSDREKAEYHYVERDLRNIGILTAVMVALLFVAWFVFNSLGIIG
jgi:hypothetical protein